MMSATPLPKEIKNFGWVEPWLARGAHPRQRGFRWLAENEFNIIVNLRMRGESKVAEANLGLYCIHIPVRNDRPPGDAQAVRWLQICRANRRRKKTFIHCDAGAGRTSTFCAILRIAEGVPLEAAIAEQERFGFKPRGEHSKEANFLAKFAAKLENGDLSIPDLRPRSG